MATPSNVLFQRDEDGESDAWDDTVLIKAYDNAVSVMKAKLAAQHPQYAASNSGSSKKKKKGKQKAKKKKHSVYKSNKNWKIGDFCQAVYTEDGEIYSAQILTVDNETETCLVKYVGYGNEEEHPLDSLLPALSDPSSQDNKTDTASEADSFCEMPKEKQLPSSHKQKRGAHVGSHSKSRPNVPPWNWNNFAVPQPPPPVNPHFPSVPHPSNFPPSGFGAPPQIPPMFPGIPPPPPMFNQGDSDENEALYSMLISWYMSGYHTGYYQGLKSARSSSLLNGSYR